MKFEDSHQLLVV